MGLWYEQCMPRGRPQGPRPVKLLVKCAGIECTPARATARVPALLQPYPRPYNDYGCMALYRQCTPARAKRTRKACSSFRVAWPCMSSVPRRGRPPAPAQMQPTAMRTLYVQCTPARATARVPTPRPLYPRPYNDYGCMARMSQRGRPQGSPPRFSPTPARTMTTVAWPCMSGLDKRGEG